VAVAWLSRPIFVGMSNVGVGPVVCGRAQPEHHTWRRGKGERRKNDSPYVDSMTKKKKNSRRRLRGSLARVRVSSSTCSTASSSGFDSTEDGNGVKRRQWAQPPRVVIISARLLRSSSTWPRERRGRRKKYGKWWYNDDADPLCSVCQRRHRKGVGSDRTDPELPHVLQACYRWRWLACSPSCLISLSK
jgi:hypothetical protein